MLIKRKIWIIISLAILLILLLLTKIMIFPGKFRPKIDYNNSLTNLACSIQKYFDIPPLHNTLSYIDELLQEKKPENVILLLIDGLGSKALDKFLNKDDFLIKNRVKDICAVFPPTTASCLTSVKTGLNPSEHGWLGWTTYVPAINKIIALYIGREKGRRGKDKNFLDIKNKYYYNKKTITDLITEKGKDLAFETSCYPYNVIESMDGVFNKVIEKLKIKGKKYIFAYYPEPDEILHHSGEFSQVAKKEIEKINRKIEEYSKLVLEYKNTMMFIVSDHGHIMSKRIDIRKSNIMNFMDNKHVFIESRSPAFIVKKGEEENFKNAFNKEFGNDFYLLSKEEILKYNLFGECEKNNEHELFESSFGDFMAFSKDYSRKALMTDNSRPVSFHGGYSDEEIYVPLIVISN